MTYEEFEKRFQYDPDNPDHQLGSGGFGTVFKAKDTQEGYFVAIKESHVRDAFKQFTLLREYELAQSIPAHENIIEYLHGYRFTLGRARVDYAVLFFYEHGNLNNLLKRETLNSEEKFFILRGILRGLAHLHQNHVIHRDLKNDNIMIDRRHSMWVPKVADFGLGKIVEEGDEERSVTNTAIGISYAYAAPEQVDPAQFLHEGQTQGRIRKNVDLWAVGVIAYRLFVGKMPFRAPEGTTDLHVRNEAIRKKITSLDYDRFALHALPDAYAELIRRCLVLDRNERVQSAEELLTLLGDSPAKTENNEDPTITDPLEDDTETLIDNKKEDSARTDPAPQPPTPPDKKNPLPLILGSVFGLLAIVAAVFFMLPKEADAWKETQKAATPKALQGFLDEYPNGKFAKTAHQKLDSLASLAFTEAQSTHTQEAYEAFQKDFYRKPYFLWADSAIDKMQWEATTATNTAVAYQQYKQDRPNSYLLPQADSALKAIEDAQQEDYARDQAAFEEAQSQNTRAGYKKYLDAFPQGRYAAKAEKQYKALKPKLHPEVQKLVDNLVYVKGGTFQMGSKGGHSDEKPVHSVTLSDFYMMKTEVTVGQFAAFVKETGYKTDAEKGGGSYIWDGSSWEKTEGVNWRDDEEGNKRPQSEYQHPVVHVSWNDAKAYCAWLSKKIGKIVTLPTEAQWEYAARGGKKSKGYKYAGSSSIDNVAWYGDNSSNKTHPVGRKAPNELGLYDMSGNVWEWCADWYDGNYYKNSPSENPTGPSSGESRVLRGGCWNFGAQACRVAYRGHDAAANRSSVSGFRCAVSP